MLGIDITRISRFANPKATFINKVLHPEEIVEYEKAKDKQKFLAARWALKEALFKADNDLFHFNRVNIKTINRVYTLKGFKLTTTTEGDYYIAIALKES